MGLRRQVFGIVLVASVLATSARGDHWWRCDADNSRPYKFSNHEVWTQRSSSAGSLYESAWSAGIAAWENNTIMVGRSLPFADQGGQVDLESGYYGETNWLGLTQPYEQDGCTFRKVRTIINATHGDRYSQYIKNSAACHELGHAWGLHHRDSEPGVQSCMGAYDRPDAHDADTLRWIYGVTGSSTGGSGGGGAGTPAPCLNSAGNLAPYCSSGCSSSRPCDKKCRLADESCSTCGQYGNCTGTTGGGGTGGSNNLACFANQSECESVCSGVCERRINCGSAQAYKCFE